tara:strand:- start:3237 stop:4250 length:1014 start_codon:yes stop_codon:yes gene_type:complete
MSKTKLKKISKGENKEIDENLRKTNSQQGLNNSALLESVPSLESTSAETVYQGSNNSFVIMGRDRPDIVESGFGGRGANDCGRLDLFTGLASTRRDADGEYNTTTGETLVSPSFATTAARIYISQKSDIDSYMGLAQGIRDKSKGLSTVAAKADTIRMHGRYDIKLITGRGKFEGLGKDGERMSHGGVNQVPGTICFIAGNYTEDKDLIDFNILNPDSRKKNVKKKLQPITKGHNLVDLLDEMLEYIAELSSMVDQNAKVISKLNNGISRHTHTTAAGPTSPPLVFGILEWPKNSINKKLNKKDGNVLKKNIKLTRINYLNKNIGSKYINSKFVYTT